MLHATAAKGMRSAAVSGRCRQGAPRDQARGRPVEARHTITNLRRSRRRLQPAVRAGGPRVDPAALAAADAEGELGDAAVPVGNLVDAQKTPRPPYGRPSWTRPRRQRTRRPATKNSLAQLRAERYVYRFKTRKVLSEATLDAATQTQHKVTTPSRRAPLTRAQSRCASRRVDRALDVIWIRPPDRGGALSEAIRATPTKWAPVQQKRIYPQLREQAPPPDVTLRLFFEDANEPEKFILSPSGVAVLAPGDSAEGGPARRSGYGLLFLTLPVFFKDGKAAGTSAATRWLAGQAREGHAR